MGQVQWTASPLLAWLVSQSAETQDSLDISAEECRTLRTIARRTLHYFDTFVDSGIQAGHLIALSATCRDWAEAPYAYLQAGYEGIADHIAILAEELSAIPDDRRNLRPLRRRLEERIGGFRKATDSLISEPEFAAVTMTHLLVQGDVQH